MHRCSLNFLYFQAVFLVKSYKNIMVCLREVIDDTVDVGFDILRALDIQMLVGTDMQCVGDTEMVPEPGVSYLSIYQRMPCKFSAKFL